MKTLILLTSLVYFLLEPTPPNSLINKEWVLFKVVEQNKVQSVDSKCKIYIQFDSLGNYTGSSGWNNFRGTYSLKSSDGIGMTTPSRTKRGGPANCAVGESLFSFFPKTTTYTINKDTLTLKTFDDIKIVYLKK